MNPHSAAVSIERSVSLSCVVSRSSRASGSLVQVQESLNPHPTYIEYIHITFLTSGGCSLSSDQRRTQSRCIISIIVRRFLDSRECISRADGPRRVGCCSRRHLRRSILFEARYQPTTSGKVDSSSSSVSSSSPRCPAVQLKERVQRT